MFSVVISISGSVKYSEATHLPFSDPKRKHTTGKTLDGLASHGQSIHGQSPPSVSPRRRTSHEANSPQARMQRHLHLHALVLLQDDALHHDQPVVRGHGHPHQQQPAGSEHRGQDGECAAAARAHLRGRGEEEEAHVRAVGAFGTGKKAPRHTCDSDTRQRPAATFVSQLVIAKDELVTRPVAANPGKGRRGASATDDDFVAEPLVRLLKLGNDWKNRETRRDEGSRVTHGVFL